MRPRYAAAVAADRLAHWRDRVVCRLFGYHGWGCRGRADHVVDGRVIDPGRWRR